MIYSTHDIAQLVTQCMGGPDTPMATYNTLVNAFNLSTCIAVAGVVAALFTSFAASSVFLALGYFLRSITEKELFKRVAPQEWLADGTWIDRYRSHPEILPPQAEQNLFRRMGGDVPARWTVNVIEICDFALWKNKVNNVLLPREGEHLGMRILNVLGL